MQLQYIYRADINRDINGVIKVAQNDERSIEQELREYIITRELRRHFNTFLNNYERSLTSPTDKIGVWISGFFGSGKSHFLKILSYLLSNDTVAGKKAVDYFADKFDDPMMFAQLERCAGVPTDTILFNIDSKSPINKDKTAILRVFTKVFYERINDQRAFLERGIPSVLLTSGITMLNNKVSDDAGSLDYPVLSRRIVLIFNWLSRYV